MERTRAIPDRLKADLWGARDIWFHLKLLRKLQEWWFDLESLPYLSKEELSNLPPKISHLLARLNDARAVDKSRNRSDETLMQPFCHKPSIEMIDLLAVAREARTWCHSELNKTLLKSLKLGSFAEEHLEPRNSSIPSAGKGLFAKKCIHKGEIVCYYAGKVYDYSAKTSITDTSYVLRIGPHSAWMGEEIFVDPKMCSFLACRYMNDPLNDDLYNVRWRQTRKDAEQLRCAVEAIRDIQPGEEIFISYGQAYWQSSSVCGAVLKSE